MAQPLTHDLWVDALLQQEGGVRVPEIVESNSRETRGSNYLTPGSLQITGIYGRAQRSREHEVHLLVGTPRSKAFLQLPVPVPTESFYS